MICISYHSQNISPKKGGWGKAFASYQSINTALKPLAKLMKHLDQVEITEVCCRETLLYDNTVLGWILEFFKYWTFGILTEIRKN